MKIAVVGAGRVGRALATGWARAGHHVAVAVRDPESPGACAAAHDGLPVLPIAWAVDGVDVVVLAVPHAAVPEVLDVIGETSAVVIDASNDLSGGTDGPLATGLTGAGVVADKHPGARVVKAFGTIGWEHLGGARFPAPGAAMLLCGTGPEESSLVARLAADLGFTPVEVGDLSYAPALEHLASLWVRISRDRGRRFGFALLDDSVE